MFDQVPPPLGVLIDGLRIQNAKLNAACSLALRAIGGIVVPWLLKAAEDKQISEGHRKRLLDTARQIPPDSPTQAHAAGLVINALFQALRVSNPRLNGKAEEIICGLGPSIWGRLLREAMLYAKKPDYSVRLLKIGERLGPPPATEDRLDLLTLVHSPNSEIRAQAIRLMLLFGPHGEPLREAAALPSLPTPREPEEEMT